MKKRLHERETSRQKIGEGRFNRTPVGATGVLKRAK